MFHFTWNGHSIVYDAGRCIQMEIRECGQICSFMPPHFYSASHSPNCGAVYCFHCPHIDELLESM